MSAAPETGADAARAEAAARLRSLQPWLLLGAELGMVLIVASLISIGAQLDRASPAAIQAILVPIALGALPAAALLLPTLHLWRAQRAVRWLGEGDDAELIDAAVRHQARFWAYVDTVLWISGAALALGLLVILWFAGVFVLPR